MAMRMSNINPDRAKAEAQSAIDDGLIEKSIEYNTMAQSGTNHPLAFISILWNDTRMNASLENIMKRLKVPFMEKIFAKNSDAIRDITVKSHGPQEKTSWVCAPVFHLWHAMTTTPTSNIRA